MTDWSQLSHAYGSAEDIPALLDQLASEPSPGRWNDLWSALCHQGSVYSASFAALPWLADAAGSDDREQAVSALNLAGAILAGSDQLHGAGDVRAQHAAEVQTLLAAVNVHLRTASDRNEYAYLLESLLSCEGVMSWSEALAQGLVNEEYEVSCPGCRAELFVVIGERGCFSTIGDYALSEDDVETTPLRPANPAAMDGIGRRLHGIALADGHEDIANAMTHVFGAATCPDCETGFCVADQLSADWSATH